MNLLSKISQGIIAIFALLAISNVASIAAGAPPVEGKPIPAFTMKTTSGKSISSASLKGKVVLLDFWATWCGPCKAASPMVQALHKQFGSKGFTAIGANTFEQDNPTGAAAAYAKEHGYSYTFTVQNDNLATSWGVTGIPYFVLIDKKGNVAKIYRGYGPSVEKELKALVPKLLAK